LCWDCTSGFIWRERDNRKIFVTVPSLGLGTVFCDLISKHDNRFRKQRICFGIARIADEAKNRTIAVNGQHF
jgi:hypothetical protein